MVDLSVKLGNGMLAHPVINAPNGLTKTFGDIKALADSGAAAVFMGAMTLGNLGNPEPRTWFGPYYSVNAVGLENGGIPYYIGEGVLGECVAYVHGRRKQIWLNVAEFTVDGYLEVTDAVALSGIDGIEINLSCGNRLEKGRIICFDLRASERIITGVQQIFPGPCSVKLSVYTDHIQFEETLQHFWSLGVRIFTFCNTLPGVMILDERLEPVLNKGIQWGRGGYSGPAMKPIVQGQVYQARQTLGPEATIIAVGGVTKGMDVAGYRKHGADVVAIATAQWQKGEGVFGSVKDEYVYQCENSSLLKQAEDD